MQAGIANARSGDPARLWGAGWRVDRAADDPHRAPLRAGHPVTWDAITAGTTLDGAAFVWRDPLAYA
jgi:hypothetical protein